MTTRNRVNSIGALVIAAVLTFATTGQYAFGDQIRNTIGTTASATTTITAGDGFTSTYYARDTAASGCDPATGNPAHVVVNIPAGATGLIASPSSFDISTCDTPSTSTLEGGVLVSFTSTGSTPAAASPGYHITVTVTDVGASDSYNLDNADFFVIVNAGAPTNIPPTLNLPGNIGPVEGDTEGGANVAFSISATDDEDDPDPTPICTDQDSNAVSLTGGFFPLGITTVTCTVTDGDGATDGPESFTVEVVDTTDPTIDGASDVTIEGNAIGGYQAPLDAYTNPTATDIVDASVTVDCSPANTDFFDLGDTTVDCSATDDTGNIGTASFTVTVEDTTDPILTVPSDYSVPATSLAGAVVNYVGVSATDIVDPTPTINCSPADGSTLSIGPHLISCTATDDSGNSDGPETFTVTVTIQPSTSFYAPVDPKPTINTVKAGSTVPIKFEVFAGSDEIMDPAIVKPQPYGLKATPSNVCGTGTSDDIEVLASGGTVLRYDATSGQFVYNWKTPTTKGCYELTLTFIDNSTISAYFKLK